jgi:exodeoxyribonuclease-3
MSVYVPNGGEVHSDKFELKLKFLEAFKKYLHSIKTTEENIIIGGDYSWMNRFRQVEVKALFGIAN